MFYVDHLANSGHKCLSNLITTQNFDREPPLYFFIIVDGVDKTCTLCVKGIFALNLFNFFNFYLFGEISFFTIWGIHLASLIIIGG